MISVYIRQFISGGETISNETLMYTIPATTSGDDRLIEPKVKAELGKAGSFEFSMEMGCPWYSSLLQIKTKIRVVYDGETIFYGRVLDIGTDDLTGKRKVHCEGALAFLLDSLMVPTKEEDRQKISLETYITDLVNSHNNLVEEDKCIVRGEVPGHYSNSIPDEMRIESAKLNGQETLKKYGTGSWTSMLNCLEELTSQYGGYLRIRYKESDGKLYLDWLKNYFDNTVNGQSLRLTENILNISDTVGVNSLFTAVIPEGQRNGKPLYLDDMPKTVIKIPHYTIADRLVDFNTPS